MSDDAEAPATRLNRERMLQFYEDARARAGSGDKVFADGVRSLVILNGTAIALLSGALAAKNSEELVFSLDLDLARQALGSFIQGAVLAVVATAAFALASYSRGFWELMEAEKLYLAQVGDHAIGIHEPTVQPRRYAYGMVFAVGFALSLIIASGSLWSFACGASEMADAAETHRQTAVKANKPKQSAPLSNRISAADATAGYLV